MVGGPGHPQGLHISSWLTFPQAGSWVGLTQPTDWESWAEGAASQTRCSFQVSSPSY